MESVPIILESWIQLFWSVSEEMLLWSSSLWISVSSYINEKITSGVDWHLGLDFQSR